MTDKDFNPAPMDHSLIFKKGVKILRIGCFIKEYHPGIQQGTVRNAIKGGKLDFIWIGRERFIVITGKTLKYQPNLHKNRKQFNQEKKGKKKDLYDPEGNLFDKLNNY